MDRDAMPFEPARRTKAHDKAAIVLRFNGLFGVETLDRSGTHSRDFHLMVEKYRFVIRNDWKN
jgi:hypothetical protein